MSKFNQRYGRSMYSSEQAKDSKIPQKGPLVVREVKEPKDVTKDGRGELGPRIKSTRLHGGFQGIQGKEVTVNARQATMTKTPKISEKTLKRTLKFPVLPRQQTKKEQLASIKLRILALKYGYIWERKTFGHVSPVKARQHYQKQLVKKSLQQWEDFWWKGKNEWKLNIRADYHNRFRLWLKIWKSWRTFITMRRVKMTKMKLAQKKADRVRLVKSISAWKLYIENRRQKKRFYLNALEVGKILVKRLTLTRWKNRLNYRRNLLLMKEQALHFWAKTLLYKAWECWVFNFNVVADEKHKLAFAQQLYNRRLTFKVFRCFKLHGIQRKVKRFRLHSGERFYRLQSLRCWFMIWRTTWARKMQLIQFEDAILRKGETAKKRRKLLAWKHYINLCRCKQEKKCMAWNHFEVSLKKKCLRTLQKQVQHRNVKTSQNIAAISFYKTLLMRKAWNQWLIKCENCEELRLMTLNNSVRKHYTVTLLKRMVKNWRIFCERKKIRDAERQKADEMTRRNLLPRYFGKWEIFVDVVKHNRIAQEEANKFRRECLLAKTYYHWWRSYQEVLDVQMLYRMAVLSYDEKVRQKFFRLWLTKARWKLRENKLLARGQEHYERRLKRKHLLKWNEVIINLNRSVGKLSMAIKYQNTKLLGTCWIHWAKFTEKKRGKWKQRAIADISFQRRIMNKMFAAWKVYSSNMREVQCYVEERKTMHDKIAVRKVFLCWRSHAKCLREAKSNQLMSFQYWKIKTERKCFTIWKFYIANHFFKKQESLSKIEAARTTLDQGKLRRHFQSWKRTCRLKIKSNDLNRKAFECWKRRTMKKIMEKWKMYRFLGYRKLVLRQQCMWFHNKRIVVSSLKIWKMNFQLQQECRRKSHLALWLWSFTLQRKAFSGWFRYAREKKRQKVAVNKALRRRRQWLYKVGVTKWIKFATNAIAERENFATSRHIRLSEDIQRCVQRCAMHWKRKTDQARKDRPPGVRQERTTLQNVGVKDKKSLKIKASKLTIPAMSKRPKPRRPEYLRESFNLSEIFEHDSKVSMGTTDDVEALPRKWSPDFQPVPAPQHFQKPSDFAQDDTSPLIRNSRNNDVQRDTSVHPRGIFSESRERQTISRGNRFVSRDKNPKPITSRVNAVKTRVSPVESRANLVLLPPSSFIDPKPLTGTKTQGMLSSEPVAMERTTDDVSSQETDDGDTKASGNRHSGATGELPSFLFDKDNQQSIVRLRNRMLKYYTVTTKLKNLQSRLKSLRQWSKEPRVKELYEDEVVLVHELIKKHSEDIETLSKSLGESYETIASDLQQFLNNLT